MMHTYWCVSSHWRTLIIGIYVYVFCRKRFFFSEEATDSGCDPKEVHLMYVQARDAVLNETHPVTKANAIELAAIQCQIEYGDFKQDLAKPGFLQ